MLDALNTYQFLYNLSLLLLWLNVAILTIFPSVFSSSQQELILNLLKTSSKFMNCDHFFAKFSSVFPVAHLPLCVTYHVCDDDFPSNLLKSYSQIFPT